YSVHAPLEFRHHLNEFPRNVRIELRPRPFRDVPEHPCRLPCLSIGPMRAQRVVHVAHMHEDARRVTRAVEMTTRVAAAVDHDVVLVGHRRSEIELSVTCYNDARAVRWVTLHHLALLVGELPRLVQD